VLSNEMIFFSCDIWDYTYIFFLMILSHSDVHYLLTNKTKLNVDFHQINSKFILLIKSIQSIANEFTHCMLNHWSISWWVIEKFVIIIVYVCQYNIMQIYLYYTVVLHWRKISMELFWIKANFWTLDSGIFYYVEYCVKHTNAMLLIESND